MTAIATRPATAADRQFVVSGWSTSLRNSRDVPLVTMRQWAELYRPVIEQHVSCTRVLVAHGSTGVLFGFIAYDPTTYVIGRGPRTRTLDGYVLYVYVAEPFRRHGIAARLFAAADIPPSSRFGYACRTHWSGDLRHKIPNAEYDPFRARYEESYEQRRDRTAAETADPNPADKTLL